MPSECPYYEGGAVMPRRKQPKVKQEVRLIPEYREQINVHRLCQAVLLAAREAAEKDSEKPEKPCDSASK